MGVLKRISKIAVLTCICALLAPIHAHALPIPGSGILTGLLPCPVSSITINTATEQVIAYDLNNQPVQVFACSTGVHGNTYVGTYKTSNYYDWHLMNAVCIQDMP